MGKLTSGKHPAKQPSKNTKQSANCQCLSKEKSSQQGLIFPLSLDTIGQPVHHSTHSKGIESQSKGIAYFQAKAKNQYFSKELARHLTALDSPLNKAYRRTLFDCGAMLIQEGQKVTSRYCDARWCNTCNRIRTAKLMDGYRKPLEAFLAPFFVSLTFPNVEAESLPNAIQTMLTTIRLMVRTRRRVTAINGIRKLECTYNADRDDYHPHFHFILDGEDNAKWLVDEWLKRYPTAIRDAQDITPLNANGLIELFKYTTKIVSTSKRDSFKIYVRALDKIFQAMHKVRTFQSFGNVKIVSEDIEELESDLYDIPFYESVVWMWGGSDWYSMLTGEALTGYAPSPRMIELTTEKMVV